MFRLPFARDTSGATVVEFAFIALPFIALLAGIIEIGLIYFADNALDTATNEAARLIRTGQAQAQGFNQIDFQSKVCDGLKPLFDCPGIKVDVRTTSTFASANLGTPLKPDGTIDDAQLKYDSGHGTDIVVVRVYYAWPAVLNFMDKNSSVNGKHILAAVTAFRNEPFTW